MRGIAIGVALVAMASAGAAGAQVGGSPTSRAESQVNSLNRSMEVQQQNRAAAQQNQFEVNALRNEITRPAPPPIVPYVAPGGPGIR